jgi:pimeloyl-ACP methyl ester carboxylesterase
LAEAQDPSYGEIKAPTIIIAASEDKTAPDATTSSLAESIPGADRVVVKNTGHWLLVEDPEEVARCLQNFTVVNGK